MEMNIIMKFNFTFRRDNIIKLISRLALLYFGGVIDGLGVAISIKANWGPDPLSLFYQGLTKTFHITVGQAQTAVAYTFIVLTILLVQYKRLGLGTIILPFFVKIGIDLGMKYVILTHFSKWAHLGFLALGIMVVAFGIACTINANLGQGGYNAFVLSLMNKLNKKFSQVRITIDVMFLIAGILLGGKFSITTIIIAFTIGKIISFFNDFIKSKIGGSLDFKK